MSTAIAKKSKAETGVVESLSTEEVNDFARLEGAVRRGMSKFREVGSALMEIRARKLYRADYGTWESYLEERWQLGRQWAHKLIAGEQAAQVVEAAGLPAPTAETQVRPIAGLEPEVQAEVWSEAVEAAGGDVPTPAQVEDAVEKVAPERATVKRTRKPKGETPLEEGVRTGAIPEGATVEERDLTGRPEGEMSPRGDISGPTTEELDAIKAAQEAPPAKPEETDEEYLAKCPAREQLSPECRKRFEVEAMAFRAIRPLRLEFAEKAKVVTNAAKRKAKGNIGPWMSRHLRYLSMPAPSAWLACKACDGSGQVELIGTCADCRGAGYHV